MGLTETLVQMLHGLWKTQYKDTKSTCSQCAVAERPSGQLDESHRVEPMCTLDHSVSLKIPGYIFPEFHLKKNSNCNPLIYKIKYLPKRPKSEKGIREGRLGRQREAWGVGLSRYCQTIQRIGVDVLKDSYFFLN